MKITKQVKEKIYQLARQGINNKTIYESIGISKTAFYGNKDLMNSIKKARMELMQDVSSMLLSQATTDTTAMIFLAKRLNLFSGDVNINLSSPQKALKSLEDLASANISLEHKNALKSIISEYFKAYEITELEERLSKLEKVQNESD